MTRYHTHRSRSRRLLDTAGDLIEAHPAIFAAIVFGALFAVNYLQQ